MMHVTQLANMVFHDPVPFYGDYANAVKERAHWSSPGTTYYEWLAKLVLRARPQSVLELGTGTGKSTFYMLTTLPAASRLISIDYNQPHPYYQGADMGMLAYDPRLTLLNGSTTDPTIAARAGYGHDLLFIDSEHTYEHVSLEWSIYRPLLLPGALVLMDDIHVNEGMERFWAELPNDKYDCGSIHFSGFGMFRA